VTDLHRAPTPDSLTFRPDIEGLRGVAILLVVAYHAAIPGLSGGYVGVDIFFVLSGYLITGLLIRELEQTGTIDFWRFYARRARRLLPGLTLALLVVLIVCWAVYPPDEVVHGGFATSAVSTAAYASNVYFARMPDGYFAPDREKNPFLHTWSLSVEEQFYLLWPPFVILVLSLFGRKNDKNRSRRRLLLGMALVVVSSFALSLYWTPYRGSWAYFTSIARAWEFALGGFAVVLPERILFSRIANNGLFGRWTNSVQLIVAKVAWFPGWIGLGGIVFAGIAFTKRTFFPGVAVLLPAISTTFVLRAGAAHPSSSLGTILRARPLQNIGRLSYSWYLWHWSIFVVGAALVTETSLPLRIGFATLSLALSAASYHFVESPIRNARKLAASHAYSFGLAGLLAILGISSSLLWRQVSIRKAMEPAQRRFSLARNDFATSVINDNCANDVHDARVRPCVFGAENSSEAIVLLGDSHAAHWFPALEPAAAKRRYSLITIIKLGCPIVDSPLSSDGQAYVECAEWRKGALEKIRQIQPVLTIVSSTERYWFQGQEWEDGINKVVKSLAEASPKIVMILRDTPSADFDIPSCLSRRLWRPFFIPSSCQFSVPASKIYQLQVSAAARFDNVITADLSLNICPKGVCPGIRDNIVMYRDADHLTASYARTLEDALGLQIDTALARAHTTDPSFVRGDRHPRLPERVGDAVPHQTLHLAHGSDSASASVSSQSPATKPTESGFPDH
jgi:peptidoglycan/LPS O-acetylase OafA/YrhL